MTYEAYEEPARRAMTEIVARRPRAAGPTSNGSRCCTASASSGSRSRRSLVVVSSPHRAEAFDAARFCIDTLKETVPIWKQEHWAGGSDWASSSTPSVRSSPLRRIEAV